MNNRFDGFEFFINIPGTSVTLLLNITEKKGKVSDVAEMLVRFASKSLTPPRMH